MIIPWEKLSGQALEGIIEEYVLREGTDYGQRDFSLDQKKLDVKKKMDAQNFLDVFQSMLNHNVNI